ncbi:hypothetical protein NA78x_002894 [Anatilimnocola sp. NA78]|uniref:hypothetical protein n=1 Tax=Anatilimnocola sp. NA78 TaxID=3415683 RepID=UPI003CE48314
MTLLVDGPTSPARNSEQAVPLANRLRHAMAAARVAFTWFGSRKSLTAEQKSQAADTFDAERDFLSARKKLIDTTHPAMKAVTSVRGQIIQYWRRISLPYPEAGIRLIRRDDVGGFHLQLTTFKAELAEAVEQLEASYTELKSSARQRLGQLFNASDYPATLRGMFDVSWDWPAIDPPQYLQQLSPELYRQECERVQARFTEAMQLAEQAFFEEFSKLLEHLSERLTGEQDGKPKVFRDSAIENLREFFQRFQSLNVGTHQQLDELVAQAQRIVHGVAPQKLRDDRIVRREIASQLSGVQSMLDGLMVDRPRRNLVRRQH